MIASLALMVWGAFSFQNLPIDAYPDLSPPHVEIITQWPGHAAEEVERLVTIPLEIEMNGIPRLEALRSISLYGLSAIEMNFEYGADPYFVREQAFERMANASVPSGLQPSISPLFSPSGLIYRYVLQSPDRSPQDLKVIEDWVLERHYRSIQGVADDSGFGGTTMQYQVLLDPNKLFSYGVTVPQVTQQLSNNNANAGGGFYSQGGQFYYIRGLGLVRDTADIGNIVLQEKNGIPVYVKDIAKVEIGHAPRLGQFGYMKQDEAVEGVILMRVGEQAQVILRRVEAMTKDLNEHVLPPDVKVVPYYDRQGLIEETTKTVEANLLRGMLLVLIILGLFLFSVRTALIVAVTIPFALMFSFICLDWRHIPANLLSIGAIDFGIIVDGAVVMVENIFRELAARYDEDYNFIDVIRAAAQDVERPIFYAIAVIIAGYLPIYVLAGPSGRLFQPMADTMSFALLGSLLCTLTLLPVLCAFFLRRHVHEPRARFYEWVRGVYGRMLGWCLRNRLITVAIILAIFGCSLLLIPYIGGEFMPHLDEGALWVRATTPYTISFEEASKLSPQIRDILSELSAGDHGRQRTGPARRWHRSHRLLQQRILRRLEALQRQCLAGQHPHQARIDRSHPTEAVGISRRHLQLHAAGRGRGGRGRNRIEEFAGGEDLRPRPGHARRQGRAGQEHSRQGSRHHGDHGGAGTGPAQPDDYAGPRQAGALRPERGRRQYTGGNRHRRHGGHSGDSGRAPVRPGGAHAGAVPQRRERHQEPADRHARRPVSAAPPVLRNQGGKRRVVHLSRIEFALHRSPVQRGRPRPGQRRERSPRESRRRR